MRKSSKQVGAFSITANIARQIKKDHPEIVESYRQGMVVREIINFYGIESSYGVTREIARGSVGVALRGGLGVRGLISKSEAEKLALEHLVNSDARNRELGKGIFGMSPREREEKVYSQQRKRGTAIYGLTTGERVEAGKKSALVQGFVPWDDEGEESESQFALKLSQMSQYRRGSLIRVALIADTLNRVYHKGKSVRTAQSVRNKLRKFS